MEDVLNALYKIEKKTAHNGYMWATDVKELVYKILSDHEAQLKAKDDEIEKMINEIIVKDNDLDRFVAIERKKSRSIVAMLFWHMKRDQRIYRSANRHTKAQAELYYFCSKDSFTHAYKMLKDNT